MDEPQFLTVSDVASLLQLNQQTVRNWIEQGRLPALRVGRRIRIRRADLDALINGGSTVAPPADVVARERLAAASQAVSGAAAGTNDGALVAALGELSEAARALADVISRRHT